MGAKIKPELQLAEEEKEKAAKSKDEAAVTAAQTKIWGIQAHLVDHYDFQVRSSIDMALLMVPESSAKRFHNDWGAQDATNLLNIIEALCPEMQSITVTEK